MAPVVLATAACFLAGAALLLFAPVDETVHHDPAEETWWQRTTGGFTHIHAHPRLRATALAFMLAMAAARGQFDGFRHRRHRAGHARRVPVRHGGHPGGRLRRIGTLRGRRHPPARVRTDHRRREHVVRRRAGVPNLDPDVGGSRRRRSLRRWHPLDRGCGQPRSARSSRGTPGSCRTDTHSRGSGADGNPGAGRGARGPRRGPGPKSD